ncbi:hypothetical protein NPIL_402271 [Nephila pilipes]|uniref:Uncharacterized protein n=1 Tax=Nephila pilipes TaxID=299642 RepID=A0A8X6P524_NEPPI|nr:hypothetical protein NPIL_402271 [Nephila pilipes]
MMYVTAYLCLKSKLKQKMVSFIPKAVIKPDGRCDDPYLLGNRTAELINSSEQGIQLINAVVTRSAGKIHPTEAGKEIIARGLDPPPAKTRFPVRRERRK